ncbi:MAG: ATP-dependent helicase [Terrimesophilobacter sp.]
MRDRPGALYLLAAQSDSETTKAAGPTPTIDDHRNDSAEARAVASRIAELVQGGTKPQNIAVLYRVNAQSVSIGTALDDAGIAFQVRGGSRFFDLPEVKQAIMMLKGATIVKTEEALFKTVSDVLRSLGWSQHPPEVGGAVRTRWESLNALMLLAEEQPNGAGLKEFVAELVERSSSQHEPTMAAVTLATVHSAKGLEWDAVFLIGLQEGLMPIGYATTESAIEEERRLLYVGITRARQRLHLSWSASHGQRAGVNSPSRFLADLSRPAL